MDKEKDKKNIKDYDSSQLPRENFIFEKDRGLLEELGKNNSYIRNIPRSTHK